jgi:hypothetical protein
MLAAQQWTRRFSYAHWGGYDDGKQVRTPLPQCHPRASMRKKNGETNTAFQVSAV